MPSGGKRPGAGRPKGSKTIPLPDDFKERLGSKAVDVLEAALNEGDTKVAMWVHEQIHGKAKQRVEQSGPDGGAIEYEIALPEYTDGEVLNLAEQVAQYREEHGE